MKLLGRLVDRGTNKNIRLSMKEYLNGISELEVSKSYRHGSLDKAYEVELMSIDSLPKLSKCLH